MEPQKGDRPHLPGPSLYPIAFAVGVACILVGLIVSPLLIAPIGAGIALFFGYLWARDATGAVAVRRNSSGQKILRAPSAVMRGPRSGAC